MLTLLKDWEGKIEINGIEYDSVQDARSAVNGPVHIILTPKHVNERISEQSPVIQSDTDTEYRISVKAYMTRHATPEFDFMAKFNNDNPMPIREMQGTVEKETRGMLYMNLHGFAKPTITCMCCGKELTNPISRAYGIGPVCLNKIGITRDIEAVDAIKEDLVNIAWSGWVIKSAITKQEVVTAD